jgi:CheY-like chemotaxis protein
MRRVGHAVLVEFSVADEGGGIDDADRPHIFEPFFTTREHQGGSGLGLATVLGTAEQHGGTVRVEARPERGSIFTITLPAVASSHEQESERAESAGPKRDAPPMQLLIIDDETQVADVTRRMLQMSGHQVRVASRPDEALRIWAEHGSTIDLVICDVVMAHMRGPELVAALAQGGVTPRVLFITGYSEEAVRAELGHPVLAKPFSAAALLHAIADAAAPQ